MYGGRVQGEEEMGKRQREGGGRWVLKRSTEQGQQAVKKRGKMERGGQRGEERGRRGEKRRGEERGVRREDQRR